jgi:hypothetical protein
MFQKSSNVAPKSAGSAPAAKSASPAAAPKSEGSVRPTHTLNVRLTKDGEMQKISGFFASESKSGNSYLSVSVKEDIHIPAGAVLYIFQNTPKS